MPRSSCCPGFAPSARSCWERRLRAGPWAKPTTASIVLSSRICAVSSIALGAPASSRPVGRSPSLEAKRPCVGFAHEPAGSRRSQRDLLTSRGFRGHRGQLPQRVRFDSQRALDRLVGVRKIDTRSSESRSRRSKSSSAVISWLRRGSFGPRPGSPVRPSSPNPRPARRRGGCALRESPD